MIYQVHQQDAELRGEERGEQKEKINNAKGMLHEGLSADLISRVTGLPISEINSNRSINLRPDNLHESCDTDP